MSGVVERPSETRRKVPVPHKMTVRFDLSLRAALDSLAQTTGITYDDGRPRDAELVRVMLVSALLADQPVVIQGYGQAVARVRSALRNAVDVEKGQLAAALRGATA